jgi:hypothetical protein
MLFTLTGFTQELGFRVFAFEAVAADRSRSDVTVRIDLALSRRYGIRIQELPLLCRALLERGTEAAPSDALTFSEADMLILAEQRAVRDAANQKKTGAGRRASSNLGSAWRNPQPGV